MGTFDTELQLDEGKDKDESGQHSQWEQLRVLAQKFSGQDCCQLLRDLEMDDSGYSDEEKSEDAGDKILLIQATKRNLLSELDCCVSSTKDTDQPIKQTMPKKQKRGPEPLVDRPRRNVGDNRTVSQKAIDLQKFKNLEAPTKGLGTSFTSFNHEYLSDIADKIDLSLGKDKLTSSLIIDDMINEEKSKSKEFENKNPEVLLPANLDVDLVTEDISSQPQNKAKDTWSQVVQISINAAKQKQVIK